MSDYQITTPAIDGLVTNEYLEYEGIVRPWRALSVCDGNDGIKCGREGGEYIAGIATLERYLSDIQGLISKKIYDFGTSADFSNTEGMRLIALVQELIKVKRILTKNAEGEV